MANKKGFTLIELLVVIAIIALLLSILTPALNQVKERGKRAVCMSNIRQLALANIMYAQLYKGRFIPVKTDPYEITLPDGTTHEPQWPVWCANPTFLKLLDQNILENLGYNLSGDLNVLYYGLPKKFRCPSYPSEKASVAAGLGDGDFVLRTSYGTNITDGELASDPEGEIGTAIWNEGPIVDQIKRPADKLLFTDSLNEHVTYADTENDGNYNGNYINHWDEHGEISNLDDVAYPDCYYRPEPMYRHSDGANVAFCDGHVEYLKKTEMFYFTDDNKPNAVATNVDDVRNNKLWSYFR